ncbi:MAG: hypothetical protein GY852_11775 [bacterium]|nr:hypothetical protein [bacterium]
MANVQRNLTTFRKTMANRMRNAGFPSVDNTRMQKRLMQEGLWKKGAPTRIVQSGEMIYNRGIGSKKSSFFVFVKSEPSKNKVTVYYYNPDTSSKAPMRNRHWKGKKKGPVKAGQEYLIRKVYKGTSDPTAAAERILKDILHFASLKPDSEYRMESHIHCGWMPQGYRHSRRFRDDGMSQFEDIMRMNALYARDIVSLTSHNSFSRKKFSAMEIIAQEMGMIMMPGMELTAPGNIPNGPHLLLWFSDFIAAHEGELIATKRRSDFAMPPFNDDLPLHKVLPLLYNRLAMRGELIIGAAHPFNLHNADHPVFDVGMMSTIETGPFNLGAIDSLLEYVHAIETWNISMGDTRDIPHLKSRTLQRMVDRLLSQLSSEQGKKIKPTPNAFSTALPNILTVPFECFGTDDHTTSPMNYVADGAPQARGHTIIDLGNTYSASPNKPTSTDIVQMLHHGLISMRAQVFTEVRKGYLQVPWGRREMNKWTRSLRSGLEEKANKNYVRTILRDLARFKFNAKEMRNLARSYGWGK